MTAIITIQNNNTTNDRTSIKGILKKNLGKNTSKKNSTHFDVSLVRAPEETVEELLHRSPRREACSGCSRRHVTVENMTGRPVNRHAGIQGERAGKEGGGRGGGG